MENTPPILRSSVYFSKAVTVLCESAHRYDQSLKRKSILQMIDQERLRRKNIEVMRQDRMDTILQNKSENRESLSLNQSALH